MTELLFGFRSSGRCSRRFRKSGAEGVHSRLAGHFPLAEIIETGLIAGMS